jgi:CBS domain-containing protein
MRRLSDIVFNQKPLVLPEGAMVSAACRQMADAGAGSVLVVDDAGRLRGIFTGRDVVCRVVAAGKSPSRLALGKVMTPEPVTLGPEKNALDALRAMWDGGFRHLPVLKDGRIMGVVSRGDFKGDEHDRMDEERDLWEHMR